MNRAPQAGPLPDGLPVVLDPDVRRLEGGSVLLGGDPGRLVRLRGDGDALLAALAEGRPADERVRGLARTLVDGGLAHPRPSAAPVADLVVVVPVRDRAAELDRCLTALGTAAPVLVVDDGSRDPAGVAEVCRRHGAQVLALRRNRGPAGARNAGLAATGAPIVALLDSDCLAPPGWLEGLVGHFSDPAVAAVAPRVRSLPGAGLLGRYAVARGPLDLGEAEGAVRPGTRVSYVPTAALVVRRSALAGPEPFDGGLRYGEDVDLVWRLHDAGWRLRYDPRTVVLHAEPERWAAWLERRYRYGTSAGPLGVRHPRRLTPLVLTPWPTASWLLLVLGRPLPALACAAVPAALLHRRLRPTGLARRACVATAVRATAQGVLATAGGLGGAGTVVTGPLLLGLLARRSTRRTAAVLLLAPPLLEWCRRRPALDPVRWTAVRLVDDGAYAAGVWRGCWNARTLAPLRVRRSRPR